MPAGGVAAGGSGEHRARGLVCIPLAVLGYSEDAEEVEGALCRAARDRPGGPQAEEGPVCKRPLLTSLPASARALRDQFRLEKAVVTDESREPEDLADPQAGTTLRLSLGPCDPAPWSLGRGPRWLCRRRHWLRPGKWV